MNTLRRVFFAALVPLVTACAGVPAVSESPVERASIRPRFEDAGVEMRVAILSTSEVGQLFGQRLAGRGVIVLRLSIHNRGTSAQRLARDNIRLLVPALPDGTPEDFYRPMHPFRVAGLARAVPAVGFDIVSTVFNTISLIDVAAFATQLEPLLPAEIVVPPEESRSMLLCFELTHRANRSDWRLALDFGDGATGVRTTVPVFE